MLNIPKENVKTFVGIVCGIAVLVIISLIIDINFIHKSVFYKGEPDLTQYTNTKESTFEENKYNIVSEERRLLYYTDEIMDMINNKDFEKLYNILDENYRNLYVRSVEELKEDMDKFSDEEYTIAYDEYYKKGDMFLVDVRFEKASMTREDIINGVKQHIDTLCIREIEKGKYTVAFNGFIRKTVLDKKASNDLVNIELKEITVRADSTEILIQIENLTNETVNLYDDRLDIYLLHNNANYKYVNPNSISKQLAPNSENVYRITFRNFYSKDSAPETLRFDRIYGADGKVKKLSIKL